MTVPSVLPDANHAPSRLERIARVRRHLATPLLVSPLLLLWLLDLSNRAPRILSFRPVELGAYVLTSLETLVLWSSLLILATQRRGWFRHVATVLAVAAAALLIGGQHYFHDQYATYLNVDAAQFGAAVFGSVLNYLRADAANLASYTIPPALAAFGLILLGRRLIPPRLGIHRMAIVLAPVAVFAMIVFPCSHRRVQAAPPDVILVHAFGRIIAAQAGLASASWVHPTTRTPDYLPSLEAAPSKPRNVVLILTEGLRADVVCSAYQPACKTTPFSNRAAPDRIPLLQLRSVSSTTAISLAVLWSGMSPVEPLAAMQSSPLLFDIAHAAGWKTAYITSQHLEFANARDFVEDLPLDRRSEALDLDAEASVDVGAPDELATERALQDLGELSEPFFAVVHYANTHFPYRVDPKHAPFQPATDSKAPEANDAFMNHYRNSVYLHDMAVGTLVQSIRDLPLGERTVILFTSDHGEAFREHHQLGHTASIYEEEIHVPGWIDAPPDTLREIERKNVEQASGAFTWHLDVAPTILDLMGVLDLPELARYRRRMLGTSWLRGTTTRAVPLTNCAAVWGCPFRNWGMMRGQWKLEARQWDPTWHCFDVKSDPFERNDLGPAACGDLAAQAQSIFGRLPRD